MNPDRPFSGPVSVTLAGLTLLGVAAWSFASGLSHEMRVPRGEATLAKVVVLPPKAPPVPAAADALAYLSQPAAPSPAPAAPARRPRRRPAPPEIVVPAPPPLTAPGALAQAPDAGASGVDAAATGPAGPATPAPEPPPESTPPEDTPPS
jgi:hypothetical protein